MRILDIGCGKNKYPGAIGMDIIKGSEVDIVHDMEVVPYSFKNNEFDMVVASHILEHIEHNADFFNVMGEIHRILKDDGKLLVKVPYWKEIWRHSNPEHVRYLNSRYFDMFDHSKDAGSHLRLPKINFKIVKVKFNLIISGKFRFFNALNWLYNINLNFTEMFLSNMLAPEELQFEMIKK